MQVRSFTGRSMKDAMNRAKATFGENIVILDSTLLPLNQEHPDRRIQLSVGIPDSVRPYQDSQPHQQHDFKRYLKSRLAELDSGTKADRINQDSSPKILQPEQSANSQSGIPESGQPLLSKMASLGFPDEFSRNLIGKVGFGGTSVKLNKSKLLSSLQSHFLRALAAKDQNLFKHSSRMIIPVIGPTGAGKTTTIMKLAVNPLCFGKRKVAVISLDHHRMAAGEQLAQFSRITNIPFASIEDEVDLHNYFKSGVEAEVVLVDTPGRSPNFSEYSRELSDMLTVLQPAATILTVPLTYDTEDILFNSVLYQALGATHLFFSKLDETCRPGKLVTVLKELELPVIGLGNGQSITDDFIVNYGEALWSRMVLEI
ncbi:MAG: hypothetical protein GXO90_04495 [FCB group bacterium]|nr:hypothetical protein [FCB group bacterium]